MDDEWYEEIKSYIALVPMLGLEFEFSYNNIGDM